jgi:hypothetical protein
MDGCEVVSRAPHQKFFFVKRLIKLHGLVWLEGLGKMKEIQ